MEKEIKVWLNGKFESATIKVNFNALIDYKDIELAKGKFARSKEEVLHFIEAKDSQGKIIITEYFEEIETCFVFLTRIEKQVEKLLYAKLNFELSEYNQGFLNGLGYK